MSSAAATARATGPRTPEGKLASSLNATTHGLTSKSPLLPGEDPAEFEQFRNAAIARYSPQNAADLATVQEFADASWRLRRIAAQEARLVEVELRRMQIQAKSDRALAEILEAFEGDPDTLTAIAYERLMNSKTILNLHRHESRLSRRLSQIQPELSRMAELRKIRRVCESRRERQNTLPEFPDEVSSSIQPDPVEAPSDRPCDPQRRAVE
jgi:hypothetical protein